MQLSNQSKYILHLLQHKGGSANLKMVFLRQNVGKHAKRFIAELVDKDLITVGSSYQVGKYAKLYKLTKKGWDVKIDSDVVIPFMVKTKKNYIKSLSNSERDTNLKQMVADIQSGTYSIDEADYNFVHINTDEEGRKELEMVYKLLQSKDTWASCDADGGDRVYTVLQSLPKALRYFMKMDNQKLIEFDITNAQPYFLAKRLFHVQYYNELSQNDATKFYNLTRNGTWNTYLSNKLNVSVKVAKQMFIRYLFSNAGCHVENGVMYNEDVDYFMTREFPTIHAWMLKYNRKNYVSIALRKDESEWSHKLCNQLRENFNIKCFNVHDCIIIGDAEGAPFSEIEKFIKASVNAVIKDKKYEYSQVEYKLSIEDKKALQTASINVVPLRAFSYENPETAVSQRVNDFYNDFAPGSIQQVAALFSKSKK